MDIIQLLLKEFNEETAITRKMLERVPEGKWDWKPHTKNMSMEGLSTHVAELSSWIKLGLTTSELDFAAAPYEPTKVSSTAELLQVFEKAVAEGREALEGATEADLLPTWTLRNGDQVYGVYTKYEIIRHAMAQTIHHRAQLGVYLRLLDIPIPGSYGPSADEMNF
ncbi:MAG: damage-inducible protein DinB [Flaviaesturariibacter sp.]|nr:damage-inducible protein DinB [Flaviaesturariibacter sp.]